MLRNFPQTVDTKLQSTRLSADLGYRRKLFESDNDPIM